MTQRGVTLIEFVVVIVILGLISAGIANFVRVSVESVIGITERDQLLNSARFAVTRLRRELERAIPNSVRIAKANGEHCIQFVPFNWVGVYLDLPLATSANYAAEMPIIAPLDIDDNAYVLTPDTDFAIVYPQRPQDIYNASQQNNELRRLRNIDACANNDCAAFNDNALTLTLENGFPESSPAARVYFASESVNFCVVNNNLVRFSSAIEPTQPSSTNAASIIAGNIGNVLLAGSNTLSLQDDPFQVFDSSRLRHATVQIRLRFSRNDEQLAFQQEVHIPNAP